MKTIVTDKTLKPGETIVIYAESIKRGEEVRIVKRNSLASFLVAVCTGGVKAFMSPSRNGQTTNAHKGYRKFRVKE